MMMRRILLQGPSCLVAAVLITGQGWTAHATTPIAKCPPNHTHVLHSNRQAVIYTIREYVTETEESVNGGYTHYKIPVTGIRGCTRGGRLAYKLGKPVTTYGSAGGGGGSGVSNIALTGSMVAYEKEITGVGRNGENASGQWIVWVRDLRTGRVIHKVPTGTLVPPDPNFIGSGPATAIVVKGDGSVAWIAELYLGYYEVHALDKTGERVLATGENIKPYTLGLNGNHLYWKQNGHIQSTVLD
jgi:hypothetical protein